MRSSSWKVRLFALAAIIGLVAVACGGDDDGGTGTPTTAGGDTQAGGEFIDLGTIVGDPLEYIDPALNTTLDAFQINGALFDGLTELDFTDPDNPEVKGLVAESWEGSDDATVWTFKIKDGLEFSNGEPVLPSSFQLAWERASDPDFAGDYSYLFNFLKGGAEKLAGDAETISGVKADDEAMTLETTLSAPYGNWPTVAGFQLFYPMPKSIEDAKDQSQVDRGLMIGNGPYKLEKPRTDQEIVLVKNETWGGDYNGDTWPDRLDRIVFKVSTDPDSSYNSFEAGEGDDGQVPPGRWGEAKDAHPNTIMQVAGTRYFEINWEHPVVGGKENVKLRQAISQAINRQEISDAVYNGTNAVATSLVPQGIPGFQPGVCTYCEYDPEAAKTAFDEWKADGHSLDQPIKIQLNADAGHEPVVQVIIDNLKAVGIDAVADPYPSETYFSQLADGACVICRSGWYADYPTFDNFTYDLFHSDAIGGNNHGFYSNPEFDQLVDDAKAETDEAAAIEKYQEAERILLQDDVGVIPYLYYSMDYVYSEELARFPVTPLGIILWEQVAFAA